MSSIEGAISSSAVESGKAIGSAMKQDNKEDNLAELYKLNQVWYKMPPTLSLVSKRTITRCQGMQISYQAPLQSQTVTIALNTGEFQISGKTSFLVIQCGIDKSSSAFASFLGSGGAVNTPDLVAQQRSLAHAYLPTGGILSVIDEVLFRSSSGAEIDRQMNKGLQTNHVKRNRMPLDWYNTAGELQGCAGGSVQDCFDDKGWPGAPSQVATYPSCSPSLVPTRGSHQFDQSQNWLKTYYSSGGTVTLSQHDSTKYPGSPSSTGLVDVSYDPTYNATYNPTPGTAPWFVVPLDQLLGFFNPYMGCLLPSLATAAGNLDIRFKNMQEALIASGPGFFQPAVTSASGSADSNSTIAASTTSTTNANTFLNGFAINNIYLLLDSFQLNEGTLRRLNEAAASTEGLSVMFDTWDWVQTPLLSTSGEAQVSQARSRILRSFCVIRDQLQVLNPWANSMASEAAINRPDGKNKSYTFTTGTPAQVTYQQLLVNSYQAQLGALYFPQQPILYAEEQMMNAYYTWCKSYCDITDTNAIELSDFLGANGNNMYYLSGTTPTVIAPIASSIFAAGFTIGQNAAGANVTFPAWTTSSVSQSGSARAQNITPPWAINWGSATFGFIAERSMLLQLSGLPISNARLLRHRFTLNYSSLSGAGRYIDVFTEYTRVMKVYLGGRVVMRE